MAMDTGPVCVLTAVCTHWSVPDRPPVPPGCNRALRAVPHPFPDILTLTSLVELWDQQH